MDFVCGLGSNASRMILADCDDRMREFLQKLGTAPSHLEARVLVGAARGTLCDTGTQGCPRASRAGGDVQACAQRESCACTVWVDDEEGEEEEEGQLGDVMEQDGGDESLSDGEDTRDE